MDSSSLLSRIGRLDTVYLRLALAAGFLAAVSDRARALGTARNDQRRGGDMQHFIAYAAKLNPWFPARIIPAVGWLVTFAESHFDLRC
jgi:hypothetical protein